jgi:hypothetical protein
MTQYLIEARSFRVALAWTHNFWVLKDAGSGRSIAELHGLAYDRVTRRILPIGTTRNHSLRVFLFPHDAHYAATLSLPVSSTRMFARSRAHVVHDGADGLARWTAAVEAMPLLDTLDLTYPPYGFNIRTPGINSNSAYRTFGEIMGVRIHDFPSAFAPGLRNRMIPPEQIALARYRADARAA